MVQTLKQRLAALSLAPSSLSPPMGSSSSTSSERSRSKLFSPSWNRRNTSESFVEDEVDHDRIREVMTKVIFQAGVDYETRPMVVLNASALPDPRDVSYDVLLSRILSYLDLYVESDYTVIFFAAGAQYTPQKSWIWKAYRSLSRKYRKNLKRLFLVHSTLFSKMIFSLAGAIISPKFFRKIVYINTLSDLAQHVPLTQIDIPPAVYQENLKRERQIILPTPVRSSVFGVPLEEMMGFDGEKGSIPRVVKDCIQYLRSTGLEEEGLFRRSPSSALLKQLREAYDRGQVVSLELFRNPHLAAVLLKKYLRDLPEPFFPETMYPIIRQCPTPTDDLADMSSVTYIRETILSRLAPCVYILLSNVLHLMHEVSLRSDKNRMDAYNLAAVLCPNLVAGTNPMKDGMMCAVGSGPVLFPGHVLHASIPSNGNQAGRTTLGAVIKLCIQRYYEIFDDVRDRSEAVSLPSAPSMRRDSEPAASFEVSSSSSGSKRNGSRLTADDDDIDDAMLIMPIGPSGSGGFLTGGSSANGNGLKASSQGQLLWDSSTAVPYQTRQRKSPGGGDDYAARSEYAQGSMTNGYAYASQSKTKSVINIDAGDGEGDFASRRGSISIGRGTTRKSSGASVEATGITASGFFTPPNSAPPLPSSPK